MTLFGYMTLCSSVRNYTSCYDLLHSHPKGWFFAIFEKSSISINNDIEATSRTSNTSQQDSVGALLNISDNNKICTAAKSSALALYAICFSVLKPCSYWNSDTSDAIVEYGSAFFFDTIKSQCSSVLPENINIYGVNINVNFISSSKGTLVCTSSSSQVGLERFILQTQVRIQVFSSIFLSSVIAVFFTKPAEAQHFF